MTMWLPEQETTGIKSKIHALAVLLSATLFKWKYSWCALALFVGWNDIQSGVLVLILWRLFEIEDKLEGDRW